MYLKKKKNKPKLTKLQKKAKTKVSHKLYVNKQFTKTKQKSQ